MRSRTFGLAVRREQKTAAGGSGPPHGSLLARVNPKSSRLRAPSTRIEHRNGRIVGEQMVGSEHILAQALVQRLEPPAGAADPAGERRTREDRRHGGRRSATADRAACDRNIWLTSTWASSAGVAKPPAIGRSGAGACATVSQVRQAYFGRVMRSTRSCAGTQSSISLTLSPMTCSAPPQHAADHAVDIEPDIFARQMIGQRFATGGPFGLLALSSTADASLRTRARSLSRSSSASANLVGIEALGTAAKLRPLQLLDDGAEGARSRRRGARRRRPCRASDGAEEPVRTGRLSRSNRMLEIYSNRSIRRSDFSQFYAGFLQLFSLPKPASIRVPEIASRCLQSAWRAALERASP